MHTPLYRSPEWYLRVIPRNAGPSEHTGMNHITRTQAIDKATIIAFQRGGSIHLPALNNTVYAVLEGTIIFQADYVGHGEYIENPVKVGEPLQDDAI